jgi:two-component system response regulator (stage 0 sporulation protein A)
MGNQISLVIVDDNPDFVMQMREMLEKEADISVIGTAGNGVEALAVIRRKKPRMVLLDVVMPQKDGLEVLEEMQHFDSADRPVTIMLTAIGQDQYIRRALELGAEYYIIKPFDIAQLGKRIRQIYRDTLEMPPARENNGSNRFSRPIDAVSREEIDEEVTIALGDVSVPPHLTGYLYLKRSIAATVVSERGFIPATKELYPSLAEEFGTSAGKIERAIRGAIQKAWTRKEQTNASQYFTYAGKYKNIKPTNSEFIATIAAKIRQKMKIEDT